MCVSVVYSLLPFDHPSSLRGTRVHSATGESGRRGTRVSVCAYASPLLLLLPLLPCSLAVPLSRSSHAGGEAAAGQQQRVLATCCSLLTRKTTLVLRLFLPLHLRRSERRGEEKESERKLDVKGKPKQEGMRRRLSFSGLNFGERTLLFPCSHALRCAPSLSPSLSRLESPAER